MTVEMGVLLGGSLRAWGGLGRDSSLVASRVAGKNPLRKWCSVYLGSLPTQTIQWFYDGLIRAPDMPISLIPSAIPETWAIPAGIYHCNSTASSWCGVCMWTKRPGSSITCMAWSETLSTSHCVIATVPISLIRASHSTLTLLPSGSRPLYGKAIQLSPGALRLLK